MLYIYHYSSAAINIKKKSKSIQQFAYDYKKIAYIFTDLRSSVSLCVNRCVVRSMFTDG